MSRIGKRKLEIPTGVTVTVNENVVSVKGPKGELNLTLHDGLTVTVEENGLTVNCDKVDKQSRSMFGTTNALISNMITGVNKGYEKGLEIIGVGYRFTVKGKQLDIVAGYSHHVVLDIPEGLTVEQVSNTEITISGINKQEVSEVAAHIRSVREPEPYKGKGVRYKGEYVRRKEGKKAAK